MDDDNTDSDDTDNNTTEECVMFFDMMTLLWPFILVFCAFPILIYLSIRVPSKLPRALGPKRWLIGGILLVGGSLFLYGDELLVEIQLARLCPTKAGIYIYKTVTVPDYMWDFEQGTLKDAYQGSDLRSKHLGAPYILNGNKTKDHWGVSTTHFYIYERETGDKIVDIIGFVGGGGWVAHSLDGLVHVPNNKCTSAQRDVIRHIPDNLTDAQKALLPSVHSLSSADKLVFQLESSSKSN